MGTLLHYEASEWNQGPVARSALSIECNGHRGPLFRVHYTSQAGTCIFVFFSNGNFGTDSNCWAVGGAGDDGWGLVDRREVREEMRKVGGSQNRFLFLFSVNSFNCRSAPVVTSFLALADIWNESSGRMF